MCTLYGVRPYPFANYQIQTKFRDEARPRGGLIRVREFTMKDAYSFHTSQEDLDAYYMLCHEAYQRIYERVGLGNVVSVASDSGMMGGSLSHEFMYLTPIGEDSIAICTDCDYRANVEAAPNITENVESRPETLTPVETPGVKTIDDLCAFLSVPPSTTCKAVAYETEPSNEIVVVFMRGDMEVNETKLRNHCGCEIHPAMLGEDSELAAGFIGPYGLDAAVTVLYDNSLEGAGNLVCGGNRPDCHYTGLNLKRDCGNIVYHDLTKVTEQSICPQCGKPSISISRGIEVGNIFQLGDKYTKSMNMQYLEKDDTKRHPIMGCYGIGVGRLAASVCEEHHDENGPVWPLSIAPWQVHICCIRADQEEVKAVGDRLYRELTKAGVEVLYDDREVSAGVLFGDADLFGIPVRVIVSPRNLEQGVVEITARDKQWSETVPLNTALSAILARASAS
ncbi:MAG: proline--tRNA ligase [Oscillospiraceae bacterium]